MRRNTAPATRNRFDARDLFADLSALDLEHARHLLDAVDVPGSTETPTGADVAIVKRLRALSLEERATVRRSILTDTDGFVHVRFLDA